MRKKCSFLLTILPPEEKEANLHGRLEVISSGKIERFASLEELQALIEEEIKRLVAENFLPPESYPQGIS